MDTLSPLRQLQNNGCQYAFYYARDGEQPVFHSSEASNPEYASTQFLSASIIKVPILLAWVHLERTGFVDRGELCNIDDEPQVEGAGFSWLLRARQLPYQDVLLMMIALSDNLCTNLVIRRIGIDRLQKILHEPLGLQDTQIQRKLMDYDARAKGLDNWISARDCIRLYDCIGQLRCDERAWVESMLAVNQDDLLLRRSIQRDTLTFYHKTGSMTGVLHDWGYTDRCRIFLLTQNVTDEPAAYPVFGQLGRLMAE